ncbi:MAG TPA: hypothetical protein VGX49_11160 [Jatrophihabitans sp.]|nr:hypothetical protein [Jatrophihabitans sp.]
MVVIFLLLHVSGLRLIGLHVSGLRFIGRAAEAQRHSSTMPPGRPAQQDAYSKLVSLHILTGNPG